MRGEAKQLTIKIMKEQFIPYEQALELKELGFNEPCFAIWSGFDEFVETYLSAEVGS